MAIIYSTIDVPFPKIKRRKITNWIKKVIEDNSKKAGDISIIFCSDEEILKLNKQYLNHNYYTDIITFATEVSASPISPISPLSPASPSSPSFPILSSDLFISLETVKTNAKKFNTEYYEELHRVIIHGILHLCGYDDKTRKQKKLMREMEDKYLGMI